MPNASKLRILAEIRDEARLRQVDVARALGLADSSRDRISQWETGADTPPLRHREKFIKYLSGLLHEDRERFQEVWRILHEEWHWSLLTESEWQQFFPAKELSTDMYGNPTSRPSLSPDSEIDDHSDQAHANTRGSHLRLNDVLPGLSALFTLTRRGADGAQAREDLLSRVKDKWITQFLHDSLHGATLIELGMDYQTDAVSRFYHSGMLPRNPASGYLALSGPRQHQNLY